MTTMQDMIRKARRRTFIDRALSGAGFGLLVGCGLSLALLVTDRLANYQLPPLAFFFPALLGFLGGILVAFRQIPHSMIAAVLIDRQMRLQDQFGSAESLLLAESTPENPAAPHFDPEFAQLVQREADRLASRIDIRTATPIQITPIWGGSLALALTLWMGVLFLPSRQAKADPNAAQNSPEQLEEARLQRAELASSIDETVEQLQDQLSLDDRTREELEALNELADQLSAANADDLDIEHIRDESAARLNEIADRLAEQSERDLAARDQVASKFAGLETPDPPESAQQFTDALKRGDFQQAADRLDELTDGAQTMTDEQRESVANHLRDLGEQLEQSGDADQLMTEERKEQLEQALRDQGLDDEAIEAAMNDSSPTDERQRSLEESNVDPEIAGELSRDIERLKKQEDFNQKVQEDTEQLKQALNQAAEQVENPEEPIQDLAPDDSETDSQETSSRSETKDETGNDESNESGDETRDEAGGEAGNKTQEQTDSPSRDQSRQEERQDSTQGADPEESESQTPTQVDEEGKTETERGEEDSAQSQTQGDQEQQSTETPPPTEEQPADSAQEQQQQQQMQDDQSQREGTQGQSSDTPQEDSSAKPQDNSQSKTSESPQGQQESQPEGQQQATPDQTESQPQSVPDQDQPPGLENTEKQQQSGEPPTQPQDQTGEQRSETEKQSSNESTPPGMTPDPESMPNPEGQPSEENKEQQQPGNEGEEPSLDPEQVKKMMDMLDKVPSSVLRKMAERAKEAAKNKEISEGMKEQAKKMLEGMSEEQRQKLSEMFDPPQSPQGENENPSQGQINRNNGQRPQGQGRTPGERVDGEAELVTIEDPSKDFKFDEPVDLDLRGDAKADQVISEWLSEGPIEGDPGRTTRSGRARRLTDAKDVAQRAVDDSVIPPRYHNMIKRYFGNINKTVEKAASDKSTAPPEKATPASDPSSKPVPPKKTDPD